MHRRKKESLMIYGLTALISLFVWGCQPKEPIVLPATPEPTAESTTTTAEDCLDKKKKGCEVVFGSDNSITKATSFKDSYEYYNGKENEMGKIHRTITIPEENPFVESDLEELIAKLKLGETFYVYFGDQLCPWCRAVIEQATLSATENEIETIYYIDVWDEEGNELFRDKYQAEHNEAVLILEGSDEYKYIISEFKDILDDYTLKDDNDNEIVIGKRIYAPNFIKVVDGKAVKLVDGIPEGLEDPRAELTPEMLKKEKEIFDNFWK